MSYTYRVSSLGSAFLHMWRAWRILVPVIVVNTIVQAITVWPPYTYGSQVWTVVSAIVSGCVMWIAFGVMCAAALAVADGTVQWRGVLRMLRTNGIRYVLWSLCWGVAVAIGLALFVIPGIIIIAMTCFLALAVLDGQTTPLLVNLRVIGRRFWRWLITSTIVVLVLMLAWYASGLVVFFLRPPVATLPVWLVGGWLIAWFTTAYALIYRSAVADRGSVPPEG